jgi:predicted FMN-binding regulatory protein PaiB
LKTIVGFRIEINRLEGEWKPSQNRPEGIEDGSCSPWPSDRMSTRW